MTFFEIPIPTSIVDVVHMMTSSIAGEWSALVTGILAGALAVAFMLGGFWALRGRPTLVAPHCRRCRINLRGSGHSIPDVCPECGYGLVRRNAVRWLRFRRQGFTTAITAPIVLFGGGLLAVWMALEVMRVGHDTMRRWRLLQSASHVNRESAVIEVADAPAPPRDIRNIGRVPGVGSPHVTPPSMAVRIHAFRTEVVREDLVFQAILESLTTERPDAHVTEAEIELLRQLSREMLQGKFDYRPSIRSPQGAVTLAQLLFELGYVDAQWMQEATRTTNESLRVVIAPQVNPGTVLGVRVVDRFGTRASLCRIVSITRRTEDVELSLPSNYGRYRPPFGLFLASDELGSDEVVVEWEGPALAWTVDDSADSGSIRISDQRRRETLRYDVVAGLEVLPDLRVSLREQVSTPISSLCLLVAECGERDAVHFLLTNNASTQMRGRWTVMIDDAWCDLGYATTVLSRRRFGVLLAAPRGGWPDQLTVRFDPVEGASDRLPTPPSAILGDPNARLLWAYARAVDSTWTAALEFTLLRMDRTDGEAIEYRWQSE